MRRRIVFSVIMLLILMGLGVAGCSKLSPLHALKAAQDKTEEVKKGQWLGTFSYNMDLSGSNLTPENSKNLNLIREMKGNFLAKFDKEKQLLYIDGHLDLTGMGMDVKVWSNGEKTVLLLPLFTKYLVFDQAKISQMVLGEKQPDGSQVNFFEKFKRIWTGLLQENNVTSAGERLISTGEGDIRATEYQVTLGEEEFKGFIKEVLQIFANDPEIRAKIQENGAKYKVKGSQDILNEMDTEKESAIKSIDQTHIDQFQYTAAVDRDSYLVEENVLYKAHIDQENGNNLKMDCSYQIKRWGYNQDIQVDFPQVDANNSFTLDTVDENTPKIFEGLLKKK